MLRTVKATGILLTALPLSYSVYLYSSLVILRTVFFSLVILRTVVTWVYFWQTIVFGFIYVCICIIGLFFCPCFLLHICVMPFILRVIVPSAYWAKLPSVQCWPFMGRQPNRLLPSVLLEFSDRIRRVCNPFRALSSYLCGTCYFLYARWHWVCESPVFFDETVSILASGPQGFFCILSFWWACWFLGPSVTALPLLARPSAC